VSGLLFSIISGMNAIMIGIGIIGRWSMLLLKNQIPELQAEPVAIKFHMAVEMAIGLLSLTSGIMLLIGISWASYFFILTQGLLLYAFINSAGYYG